MTELIVLLDGREAGVLCQKRGQLAFVYTDSWRAAKGAYPLSLSMPLAAAEHGHAAVEPFLWGLLPDSESVIRQWALRFQVSARNAFALLAHVGEDCAGAAQFVRPERRHAQPRGSEVEWLNEADVAARIRALRGNPAAGRAPQDAGQFSLAGAQPKTALLFDGQRWGVPSGRMPTTHILKPPSEGFDGHAENEHLCLALARSLGMPAARSEVRTFEDMTAIVITRYDRVRTADLAGAAALGAAEGGAQAAIQDSAQHSMAAVAQAVDAVAEANPMGQFAKTTPIHRVHQEDLCQALRIHPSRKYQNEGGPGPRQIVELLRANVSAGRRPGRGGGAKSFAIEDQAADQDVAIFLDALVFNWLIGGTDAHAKNYSLLLGGGGMVRLAPLYDIASILPYATIDPSKAKLSMKIGGTYRLRDIGLPQWRQLAADVGTDADELVIRARDMASQLPECLDAEVESARNDGLVHPVISVLRERLVERASKIGLL